MSKNKTVETKASVKAFLNSVEDEQKRKDAFTVLEMMQEITGAEPKMWGPGIVGFGSIRYKYESGREGDWFWTGFSPRKQNLTLYIMPGFDKYDDIMARLGKYKTGKSCLYIKRLADVDEKALKELIKKGVKGAKKMYG